MLTPFITLFCVPYSLHSQGACANCGDFFGFTICNKEDKVVDWTKTYDVPKNMTSSNSDIDEPLEPSVKIPLPYTSQSNQSVYSYGKPTEHSDTEFNEPYRQS